MIVKVVVWVVHIVPFVLHWRVSGRAEMVSVIDMEK